MHIKTFHEFRPDLKICWFAVTQPGLQETCRSKNFLIPNPENFFLVTNILSILAMLTLTWTLESKVNFLFILLHHFLVVCVALTFLTHCPLCRFHQTARHWSFKKNNGRLVLQQLQYK